MVPKSEERSIYQPHEEQRQGNGNSEQESLLAFFSMGDGQCEDGCDGEDSDKRDNEEGEAGFGQGLRDVTAGLAVIRPGVDAADDAEDDADGVEDFGELDVPGGDEGLMGFIDVGCDAT